jgi:hypothetical protein
MLKAQSITDAEIRTVLRDSAKEAKAIINRYGDGIGADVRRAQLEVARSQQLMWRRVGDLTQVAIGDGADAASESVWKLMDVYLSSVGFVTENMRMSILAQGRAGITNLLSRRQNGIPLSEQVYKTSVESGQRLARTIDAMVVNGASAREIANATYKFIHPSTPGGASYAAMRLGRTELNNAFHTTSLNAYQDNPFIETVKWSLSGSHPKADKCDEYAKGVHFKGGSPGVYRPDDVPDKPHPQCFCFLEPQVEEDDEQFIKNFHAGKYNNYIDRQLSGAVS